MIIKKKEEWGIMMDKKIAKEKENKTLRFKVVSAVVVLVTVISIVSGSLSAYFSYESTQKCLQKSMHVIPVEKAIGTENESISIEHISHWLDKYEGKYAASPCSCRRGREVLGEGCADDTNDWCIAVGDM